MKVIINDIDDCMEIDNVCENVCGKENCYIAGYCEGATKQCKYMADIWKELGYKDKIKKGN